LIAAVLFSTYSPGTVRASRVPPGRWQRTRQPGDLVFFNTTGEPFSHVGIYVGNGAFVHSSSVRGQVIVSALNGHYWLEHFLGFRRPAFGHSPALQR
jgi:cell wall-associated NlpC family hydrolase